MHISKRLQIIADQVPPKNNVIDVGCDHALLDIYLAKTRQNISLVATDISEKAISHAKEMAYKYHAEDQISFFVADGLQEINIHESDVIVIAGMGCYTMLEILKKATLFNNKLILSAHTDLFFLRREVCKMGYFIQNEEIIYDKKWYCIITFEVGNKEYDIVDYEIGPFAQHNFTYIDYLYQKEKEVSSLKGKKTKLLCLLENIKSKNNEKIT